MKKIIATLLIAALALTFAACGSNDEESPATDLNTPATEETAEDAADETEEAPEATEGETVCATLKSEFEAAATDASLSAQEIADQINQGSVFTTLGMTMATPIEDNLLQGFDNYEVNGFTECVMVSPMISTTPIIAYVFTVGDGVDASAFAEDLEANANLRWNICTSADEMISVVSGNKVFFAMAPLSLKADVPSDMVQDEGITDMGMEGEIPAYDGETAE